MDISSTAPLVKTHVYPQSPAPAVYRVRDGRAASIAGVEGRWVRKKSDWRREFPERLVEWFIEENSEMLKRLSYE